MPRSSRPGLSGRATASIDDLAAETSTLGATTDAIIRAVGAAVLLRKSRGGDVSVSNQPGLRQRAEASRQRRLGLHMQRVAAAARGDKVAAQGLTRAPSGANVTDPTAGGFLMPSEMATELLDSVYSEAILAPLCRRWETDNRAGLLKIAGVDETSRANGSRFGGALAFWKAESDATPKTFPRAKAIEFGTSRLLAAVAVTNELLADAAGLGAFLERVFASEMAFKLDAAILAGSGAGQPQGLVSAPGAIVIAKETGQASATILAENLDKMWTRLPLQSRRRAVWLVAEDVDAKLGDAFRGRLEYQQAGANGSVYPTLHGRPVIGVEQAPAIGTQGDIVLADLSHFLLVDGGMSQALSTDFLFDYDQSVFRFAWKVDGRPEFASAITPFNGTSTRSPYVILGPR